MARLHQFVGQVKHLTLFRPPFAFFSAETENISRKFSNFAASLVTEI